MNADINKIRELATKYQEVIYDMGAYILDFEVEAQNNLLSQLFENRKVASRKPLDSSFKVISTEPEQAQELMQFFEQDTAWGKAKNKAEKNYKSRQN